MAAPSHSPHLPSPSGLSPSPLDTLAARGMPQRPLLLPHHSPDSSEDSASPLTPPVSDCPSSSNPSPNIVPLDLGLRPHTDHDALLPGIDSAGKRAAQAPALDRVLTHPAHPEIHLSMDPPPQQRLPHAQPGAGNGKGGCWTCRIRRKKCDEQRVGDSCQTCIRLSIDCLGWGPKRPAWMRDKQAVEAYKAGIKETLIKAGKVRGQPRLSHAHAPRSTTQASGPSAGHGPPGHSFPHAASRSMSGPAAYGGGLGSIGPVGSMGSMGALGGSMHMGNTMGGMNYDFSAQTHMPQQHQQQHSARYGPYPSPHTLGSYSPHSTQHASYTPHASAVMGAEFDYQLNFPVASGSGGQHQDHRLHRSASLAAPPSHMLQMQAQMLENRHVQAQHQQHQHLAMQHQFQHPFEGEPESSSSSIAGEMYFRF
ncbi:hypothetical protein M0805_007869 [Coniferiporia weirii]|nr:hypothetical protein M0805_007869 [Coniferiporia weirii]